ncbi:MAG TPA: energy transducer TonB [Terriglobales bacterium]
MFANSLLECAPNLQNRRRWTLLLSLALQATAVSLALMYPLFHPEGLPFISTVPKIAFSAPTVVRVIPAENDYVRPPNASQLQWPQQITVRHTGSSSLAKADNREFPPDGGPFSIGQTGPPDAIRNLFSSHGPTVLRPAPPTQPLRLSHLDEGRLLQKVQPTYPVMAKQLRVQGDVVLTALIAKDGSIEGLKVLSGHPLLIRAALDAVSQWRYKPYILNGSPVEVETRIEVAFRLEQ